MFTDYAFISEEALEVRSGLTRQQIYDTLVMLSKRRILHYIPRKKTPYIIYTRERQDKERLYLSKEVYEERKENYAQRIEAMISYASSDDNCRSQMLLRYFGEKNEHPCKQCDACLQKHPSGLKQGEYQEWKEQILEALATAPCTTDELLAQFPSNREKAEETITFLLSEEILHVKDGILYT